ncbi:MAG: transaldolase [Gammaproteobacteria bacterium]
MSPPAVNPLRQLNAAGQSVWYDNIHRAMLAGELEHMLRDDGLRGITSNPTIFEKAITSGHAYDASLHRALHADPDGTSRALFFTLAVEDIGAAADQLLPVYRASDGVDGYVSLEVSPDLAHDTAATVREARELHRRLARPNVMIKVPATRAGLPAIEALTAAGINVNVTLLFGLERYREVAERFIHGLEQRHARGETVERIASVASFFVSRVDSALDPILAERRPELQGKIAIANAKLAYRAYQDIFNTPRFAALRALGARPQRLLWASTSAKNPAYPELLYVEGLIGPDTVNTLPPATYLTFRERGVVAPTLTANVAEAQAELAALAAAGIDLGAITERLEAEGVAAFSTSFDHLLNAIGAKAAALAA